MTLFKRENTNDSTTTNTNDTTTNNTNHNNHAIKNTFLFCIMSPKCDVVQTDT